MNTHMNTHINTHINTHMNIHTIVYNDIKINLPEYVSKHSIIFWNYDLVLDNFKKLEYTEWVIWKNINRDKHEKNDIEKQKALDKFISGDNMSTDCLEKIEFSSETEYYNYYLGINDSVIDKSIIKKMVKDYITGMEWCINYYLDDCGDIIL